MIGVVPFHDLFLVDSLSYGFMPVKLATAARPNVATLTLSNNSKRINVSPLLYNVDAFEFFQVRRVQHPPLPSFRLRHPLRHRLGMKKCRLLPPRT